MANFTTRISRSKLLEMYLVLMAENTAKAKATRKKEYLNEYSRIKLELRQPLLERVKWVKKVDIPYRRDGHPLDGKTLYQMGALAEVMYDPETLEADIDNPIYDIKCQLLDMYR